ncbi:acyltransferase [Pseudolysobacter antarcticus]|uniref:Acyltransferase n=1 Tax=Pseudolysobacter antarcticus TaxID=2511995 RepID=A0A411HGZ7_9GAMM|nr:acyltransferase [Pseudolysobacter antarcticus]QBB69788.1 acyltransferase [Pseudolysobacter antarcticus]
MKRFARVWPVYAVATLLYALVLNGGLSYFHQAPNRATFWHSMAMLPADPSYVPYFSLTLPVGWTLEFEMYFYAIFAMSLLFKRLRWFVLVSWVLLTVILIPLGWSSLSMDVTANLNYPVGYMNIVTSPFVLEFLAGVVIGWLYLSDRVRISNRKVAYHVLGLGVAFAIWCIYGAVTGMHGPTNWGWPIAIMVLSMAITSKTIEISVPRFCMWLGTISYSLYLTHLISQGLITRWLVALGQAPSAHAWAYIFISTAFALSFAALSHHYLEQGLANLMRNWMLKAIPAGASRVRPTDIKDAPSSAIFPIPKTGVGLVEAREA